MDHSQPGIEFQGFDEARTLLWCYGMRARVHRRLRDETSFLADHRVAAVHVENIARADRVVLTAFSRDGHRLSADTLYVDEANERLDVAAEFDHDFTHMAVAPDSELEQIISRETGWVIDMRALRNYDLLDDRHATQRAVVLAHLGDMMKTGEIKGFLLGGSGENAA